MVYFWIFKQSIIIFISIIVIYFKKKKINENQAVNKKTFAEEDVNDAKLEEMYKSFLELDKKDKNYDKKDEDLEYENENFEDDENEEDNFYESKKDR